MPKSKKKCEEKFKSTIEVSKKNLSKLLGYSESSANREIYGIEYIIRKEGRAEINNAKFYLRKLEKEGQIKYKVSTKIIQIRAENNEIENRENE
jgi:hypothetical protein